MTVTELIGILERLPDDAEVYTADEKDPYDEGESIESVIHDLTNNQVTLLTEVK